MHAALERLVVAATAFGSFSTHVALCLYAKDVKSGWVGPDPLAPSVDRGGWVGGWVAAIAAVTKLARAPPRESGAGLRDSVDAIVVCHVSE